MPDMQSNSALLWGRNTSIKRIDAAEACAGIGLQTRGLIRSAHKGWALLRAVNEQAATLCPAGCSYVVRPLAVPMGLEAVAIGRAHVMNTSTFLFSAQYLADSVVVLRTSQFAPREADLRESIATRMSQALAWISAKQVGHLVRRAVWHLKGVPLGGINTYYLPPSAVAPMQEFKTQARLSTYGLTLFSIATDPDTVQSVTDALRSEIAAEIEGMQQRIEAGDLTRRGAQSVRDNAVQMKSKLASYERILGVVMPELRASLEAAENSAGMASLLAASI